MPKWDRPNCHTTRTHGMTGTKIYQVFLQIKQRCNNVKSKEYKWYGWREIECEWNKFEEFSEDMRPTYQEGLTIDRIDNDGNYCKQNCRWSTKKEQQHNKRSNRSITYKWETKIVTERAESLWINRFTLTARLNKPWWGIEKAFTYQNTSWLKAK
jgi:hypothetical protein